MKYYKHNFDFGIFCLIKDNMDGSAIFEKSNLLWENFDNIVLSEAIDQRTYKWSEMLVVS